MEANVSSCVFSLSKQDREDFVVDDFAHQFGHAAQRGFQVERGVDHVRHFEQQRLDFEPIGLGQQRFPACGFDDR